VNDRRVPESLVVILAQARNQNFRNLNGSRIKPEMKKKKIAFPVPPSPNLSPQRWERDKVESPTYRVPLPHDMGERTGAGELFKL